MKGSALLTFLTRTWPSIAPWRRIGFEAGSRALTALWDTLYWRGKPTGGKSFFNHCQRHALLSQMWELTSWPSRYQAATILVATGKLLLVIQAPEGGGRALRRTICQTSFWKTAILDKCGQVVAANTPKDTASGHDQVQSSFRRSNTGIYKHQYGSSFDYEIHTLSAPIGNYETFEAKFGL